MASKKKASEGIALLSMYGDEDDEMEDVEEQDEKIQEEEIHAPTPDPATEKYDDDVSGYTYGNQNTPGQQEARGFGDNISPNKPFDSCIVSTSASPGFPFVSPQLQQQTAVSDLNLVQVQKNRLTIVDYGHEDGAMSPEAEDGETAATGRVMYGEQRQISDGEFWDNISPRSDRVPTPSTQAKPTQSLEPIDLPESDAMNDAIKPSESVETDDAVMVSKKILFHWTNFFLHLQRLNARKNSNFFKDVYHSQS